MTRNKQKNMAVHVETIGLHKYAIRRALKSIFHRIGKDLHGIELRVFPMMTYLTDDIMNYRLKQVAIKPIPISSNIKTYEIDSFNSTDNTLSPVSDLTLRKLIIDIK